MEKRYAVITERDPEFFALTTIIAVIGFISEAQYLEKLWEALGKNYEGKVIACDTHYKDLIDNFSASFDVDLDSNGESWVYSVDVKLVNFY